MHLFHTVTARFYIVFAYLQTEQAFANEANEGSVQTKQSKRSYFCDSAGISAGGTPTAVTLTGGVVSSPTLAVVYQGTGLAFNFMLLNTQCTGTPTYSLSINATSFSTSSTSSVTLTWTNALAAVAGTNFYLCWCGQASCGNTTANFNVPVSGPITINGTNAMTRQ